MQCFSAAACRFIDAVAGGVRKFDVLGNGLTTIHGGGLAVSGGVSVGDTGLTVVDGGLSVSALSDVGVLDVHASLGTYTSTLILGRADRTPSPLFYLQRLTSAGIDMFAVRLRWLSGLAWHFVTR